MNISNYDQTAAEAEWQQIAKRELARPVACEILSACACTRDAGLLSVAEELGHEFVGSAGSMALAAWAHCATRMSFQSDKLDWPRYYEICAEAEALLQCGWNPGDPTELS